MRRIYGELKNMPLSRACCIDPLQVNLWASILEDVSKGTGKTGRQFATPKNIIVLGTSSIPSKWLRKKKKTILLHHTHQPLPLPSPPHLPPPPLFVPWSRERFLLRYCVYRPLHNRSSTVCFRARKTQLILKSFLRLKSP